jgi:UDP-N-acetyl-D-mannosaminuronate dehydrogenase
MSAVPACLLQARARSADDDHYHDLREQADLVVILTPHDQFICEPTTRSSRRILDTRSMHSHITSGQVERL